MEQNDKLSILNNVNSIEIKVKELEKEKETIQHECTHTDGFDISFDEHRTIKKYCSTCKRDAGFVSAKEHEDFLNPRSI
jgi:hypothetical protein